MAVTFVGATGSANTTSAVLNVAAGVVDGDIGLVLIAAGATTLTVTPPAGWNLEISSIATTPGIVVYSRAASSEPASYTWGFNSGNCTVIQAYWHSSLGPLSVDTDGTPAFTAAAGGAIAASSITAAKAGALIGFFSDASGSASITWTAPTGMAQEFIEQIGGSTLRPAAVLFDLLASASGATGSKTATSSRNGDNRSGVLIQLAESIVLTGVAGTGALGAVGPSRSIPLTGVEGAGARGTLTPNTSIPLTGVQSTGVVGNLSPIGGNTFVAVTGVASTASTGTVAPVTSIPTTGVASTGTAGTLKPSVTKALAGVATTASPGSVTPTLSIPLTGVQATGAVGSMVGMTDFVPSRMLMLFG